MRAETVSEMTPAGVWSPQVRRLTVGLVLTITLAAFQSLAIATVMPIVEDDLGGLALYGWVFSGYFLASLLGIVVAGHAADRRGPALPFAVGLVLFAAGLIGGGLAPSMGVLVLARLAQGFGGGAIPAISNTVVGRAYPPALRPRVFAVFSTAWVIPSVVGPAAATLLAQAVSWRAVFLALLPLVVLAAVMAIPPLRALGPPPAREPVPGSAGRALALVVGAGAVLAALSGAPLPLALLGAPAAVWAFAGLVPRGTLRLRGGVAAAVGVRGLLTFAFFGTDAYVTLAVTDVHGASPFLGGLALTAAAIGWTGGAWITARRLAVVGLRRIDRLGFLVLLCGIAAMLGVALGLPAVLSVPAWTLGGLGTGLAYAPLAVAVLAAAEPGTEGAASSGLQLSDVLGTALGTGLGGALLAAADGQGWSPSTGLALAFTASATMAALGIVATRRLAAR